MLMMCYNSMISRTTTGIITARDITPLVTARKIENRTIDTSAADMSTTRTVSAAEKRNTAHEIMGKAGENIAVNCQPMKMKRTATWSLELQGLVKMKSWTSALQTRNNKT